MMVVASCSSGGSTSIGSVTGAFATPSSLAVTVEPTLEPTVEPMPVPTLEPTATPTPSVTEDELIAACDKGTPIPEADTYTSAVHPLVVLYYEPTGPDSGWILSSYAANHSYDINTKWELDGWPGPIQLVVCAGAEKPVKIGGCPYTYKRTDGKVGTIIRYKQTITVRVLVASTGKTLQSKTFTGSSPGCADSITTDDLRDNPPWHLIGAAPADSTINGYATTVSTQKAK
jgi:hypothetical protein